MLEEAGDEKYHSPCADRQLSDNNPGHLVVGGSEPTVETFYPLTDSLLHIQVSLTMQETGNFRVDV